MEAFAIFSYIFVTGNHFPLHWKDLMQYQLVCLALDNLKLVPEAVTKEFGTAHPPAIASRLIIYMYMYEEDEYLFNVFYLSDHLSKGLDVDLG